MKARDLAALAALGIAGKYAYDKFGGKKKDDEPKSKAKAADEDTFRSDRGMRPDADMRDDFRSDAGMRPDADMRDNFRSDAGMRPDAAMPAAKAAVSRSVAPTVAAAPAADAVADDYVMPRTAPRQMPDATRVKQYNPDIMYADTVQRDPSINTGSATNQQAATRNKRAGVVPSQRPNDAAAARIARQSASASEIAARQAGIARKEKAFQKNVAFDPARASSVPLAHSQNVSFANQYQRGRAKGGAVKMASGGMTSSKMSKPSGASRGDGIAQRGKTRGTLR
ncbi:hypothetical protein UFOVP1276_81 [uncultured Caudovirales phage]|uniref:Uncharacterized protein n=1 Tax=uncultured Caudovirales phage TaxID=2100421 RepID=A0A6J5PKT9_9CAUD|nr:hypothetical protein UFOVP875_23 [uncultured Caudovirales phage]CAB4195171.1 hypothetical protein UFOVP1276_81 [uncultured Caudovirales phage]CAB4205349.1 hypothetical protein UFOVP1403_74 [uncultured Caudovirales phage]CAB5238122.1 hypothetical protein UFOVP1507_58 [uncultured Caudovirales phage]